MPSVHRAIVACVLVAGFLVCCLAGCDATNPWHRDLDEQLHRLIEEASGGRRTAAFILPRGDNLDEIPSDPRNPLMASKVALGRLLFHDPAMGASPMREEGRGTWSCATCHHSESGFQSGLRQAIGEGGAAFGEDGTQRVLSDAYSVTDADVQSIRTPTVLNSAFQTVTFWNGQFGSQGPNADTRDRWISGTPLEVNHLGYEAVETQAIAALATHRMAGGAIHVAEAIDAYAPLFERAFSDFPPDRQVSDETAALAIAAYERTLISSEAPFQQWLRGTTSALSPNEKRGAILFFGRAGCVTCHNGPALGSDSFHAIGMSDLSGEGLVSTHDPVDPVHLGRGGFTGDAEDNFHFKTPQLYNLADHRHFGHGASFASIRGVLEFKNTAIPQERYLDRTELSTHFRPLGLKDQEIDDLEAFLTGGLRDPDLSRYTPTFVPSGSCFPANDAASRSEPRCMSTAAGTSRDR